MSRLLAAVRWDIVLQFRNGFYYVSIFFILVSVGLLRWTAQAGVDLGLVLPALLLFTLMITTFYFVGTLVLLEKGEGTLNGLIVTPLRDTEYLAAKAASLALLAVMESLVIVLLSYSTGFNVLLLLSGMLLLSLFYTFLGIVAIARYDSINEYLLPSSAFVTLLALPLLGYFGLWPSVVFYLHPVQPALVLMRAAFAPVAPLEIAYGVAGALAWAGISFVLARRIFYPFVIRAAGA